MFYQCKQLEEADISTWDTHNTTSFQHMFCNCDSLKEVSLTVNTSGKTNVDMRRMFYADKSLESVTFSGDLSGVSDAGDIFMGQGSNYCR